MAHEFETGFVVGEKAWHGLATVLQGVPSIEEGIKAAGLDWQVKPCPITAMTPDGFADTNDYRAMVRLTDSKILGVVGKQYQPLQNTEAFGWFQPLIDDGTCALESAGSLRGGKHVWVLTKINTGSGEVKAGDQIDPYLLLSNSHDGTRAVTVAFTPIRVVCMNTLSLANRGADKAADDDTGKARRVRHSAQLHANLESVRNAIDFATQQIAQIIEEAKVMQERKLTPAEWAQFLLSVYRLEDGKQVEKKKATALGEAFFYGPGSEIAGQSLWGAYNAVTHYEEHMKGKNADARMRQSWIEGGKIRERAHDVAMSMI